MVIIGQNKRISIHTPIKGVTHYALLPYWWTVPISIHTPIKGVTIMLDAEDYSILISIHTPIKGVTSPGLLL